MFYKKSLGTGVVCRDGRCEHLRRISEYCELIANTSLRKQFTENYQEYKTTFTMLSINWCLAFSHT